MMNFQTQKVLTLSESQMNKLLYRGLDMAPVNDQAHSYEHMC
jgi:hypothetical protein